MTNRKLISIIIAAGALLFLYGVFVQLGKAGSTSVTITVVGNNPTLTVNGKKMSPGKMYLKQGDYDVVADASGFQSARKTITVGKESVTAAFLLTPVTEAAKTWAAQHNREYLEAEKAAGAQTQKEGEAFTDANPITRYLPQKTSYYSLNYRVDDKQQVIIQVGATTPLGRQVAIEKIRSIGFDPTDFKVEFTDVQNPFVTGASR